MLRMLQLTCLLSLLIPCASSAMLGDELPLQQCKQGESAKNITPIVSPRPSEESDFLSRMVLGWCGFFMPYSEEYPAGDVDASQAPLNQSELPAPVTTDTEPSAAIQQAPEPSPATPTTSTPSDAAPTISVAHVESNQLSYRRRIVDSVWSSYTSAAFKQLNEITDDTNALTRANISLTVDNAITRIEQALVAAERGKDGNTIEGLQAIIKAREPHIAKLQKLLALAATKKVEVSSGMRTNAAKFVAQHKTLLIKQATLTYRTDMDKIQGAQEALRQINPQQGEGQEDMTVSRTDYTANHWALMLKIDKGLKPTSDTDTL